MIEDRRWHWHWINGYHHFKTKISQGIMADQCDRENESSQIVNFERRPVYEIVKKMQIQDFNAALMEFKDQSMEMQPQRIVLVENPS